MSNIRTRKARADDLDFISRCNVAMAKETENKVLDMKTVRTGVKAVLDQPPLGFYLIAELHGHRIGQLMVTYEWSDWRCGMFWWIQSVFVIEGNRRQGAFGSLYAQLELEARGQKDVCGLRLYAMGSNHKAQSTYLKMGMMRTEYLMFETDWND